MWNSLHSYGISHNEEYYFASEVFPVEHMIFVSFSPFVTVITVHIPFGTIYKAIE